MTKMLTTTIKLSARQVKQLARLQVKLGLDRSALIRLAIARLDEEEAHRDPRRARLNTPDPNA